jgi:hypothetical protein
MGDLLLFVAVAFIFCVFRPKIACQVPKPPKPNKPQEIQDEKTPTPTAIIKTVEKNKKSQNPSGANSFRKRILPINLLDGGFCSLLKS